MKPSDRIGAFVVEYAVSLIGVFLPDRYDATYDGGVVTLAVLTAMAHANCSPIAQWPMSYKCRVGALTSIWLNRAIRAF